jgi:hypothetical protein
MDGMDCTQIMMLLSKDLRRLPISLKDKSIFQKKIGCGLAGGDWEVVFDMIEKELPQAIIIRKIG